MDWSKKNTTQVSQGISGAGKLPPQATELEQAILGAMMIEKECLFNVSGILSTDDFYLEKHEIIYSSILELFQRGEPVDILTVTQNVRTKGKLEFVGGAVYITELTMRVNSAANIETHARIVAEYSLKRKLINMCSEVERMCYNDQEDAFLCKERLETGLTKLDSGIESSKIKNIKEVIAGVINSVTAAMKIPDGITGIPSGFKAIDKITAGWQRKDLIIIAARPGMGKTAFILNNALHTAIRYNYPVAIFSLEMGAEQLGARLLTAELDHLDLTTDRLRRGQISHDELIAIHQNINQLISSKMYIDDTPALSLTRLRAKSFYLKRKNNIQLIIVDYLQLMSADVGRGGNREQEIATISRGLKSLAKDLDIPVIALSQLSRKVEERGGDKRPMLQDLRESGAIEQDADLIGFLYRPEYYGITEDETGADLRGLGEFIIAKHRNGSLEDVILRFESRRTKFSDYDSGYSEPTSAHNFDDYRKPYPEEEDEDSPF